MFYPESCLIEELMVTTQQQDVSKEIEFFDLWAVSGNGDYDVFTPDTNESIIRAFVASTGIAVGDSVLDLGCGSGCFSRLLQRAGYCVTAVDISFGMLLGARQMDCAMDLAAGNAERLPFSAGSFDAILLSGILHHLVDPAYCVDEVFRILKPGGCFMSFDPNIRNPFFYIYRAKTSPFYSSAGVSDNEEPILAQRVSDIFASRQFDVDIDYLPNVAYRTGSSGVIRVIRPVFNLIECFVFGLPLLRRLRAFVLIRGRKNYDY